MNKLILIILVFFLTACAQISDIYVLNKDTQNQSAERVVYFYEEKLSEEQNNVDAELTKANSTSRKLYMFENNTENTKKAILQKNAAAVAEVSRKVYMFDEHREENLNSRLADYKKELTSYKTVLTSINKIKEPRNVYWFNEDGSISNNREAILDKSFVETVALPDLLTAVNTSEKEINNAFLSIDNLL